MDSPSPVGIIPTRWLAAVCLLSFGLVPSALAEVAGEVDYNFDIKPILSDRCYTCHGPDASKRQADLRLDTTEGAQVIEPGDPAQSELFRRITSHDSDELMPPPESKLPPLSDDQIALVRRWIEQGAPWKKHWSFIPLTDLAAPAVVDGTWPANAVDQFVLSELERKGLEPSPEAPREKLIRRVTMDLTGLPPTLQEVDEYLSDSSPGAYEKVVDRLLLSDQYGERMAVNWLDLARYSDTYGYQVDRERPVWPWRDWVIKAFNENLPYDEFLTWQIAGDLLSEATDEQILATAFNRLHPQKTEGGSIEEEFRTEYVADRTHTFGTAFLGLTLECSRCHDHKYDPILQKEYYQLFAFFNNIDEFGLYPYFTKSTPTPTLLLHDTEHKTTVARAEARIAEAEAAVASGRESRRSAYDQWRKSGSADPRIPNRIGYFPFDARVDGKLENRANQDSPATCAEANTLVDGKIGQAVRLTGDDGVNTSIGNFSRNDPFTVALWINTPDVKARAVVWHRSQAWTDAGSRGYQLLIEQGHLSASLIHFWPGNAIRVRTKDPIPTNQWSHVTVTYDGSSRAAGVQIHVDGRRAECEVIRDNLIKNITGNGGNHITLGQRFRDRGFRGGLVDELQVFDRQLTALEVAHLFDGESLTRALSTSPDDLSAESRNLLFDYYLSAFDVPYRELLEELKKRRAARSGAIDGVREIMVMRELEDRRPTFLLQRGAYDAPGDRVEPGTPNALPAVPEGQPNNRLGLARWLTDSRHPLTARVAVNRFWQIGFGRGLVRTPEDFGSQGELPTHPKLLDWLAKDLIDHGWDIKRLMKHMVMSSTYRQSSNMSPALRQRDPENRLLARGPSYRLPAEMIRDNALAVSGLLVSKIGGPSVRPYEVALSFKPVERDKGEGLYRRSLYTFWKRTGPAPVMMALDAAKRDVCVVKRESTSTPLQALVLLNDPQFVESARILGQKMLRKHGGKVEPMVDEMFRLLTTRRPTSAEQQILITLHAEQLEYFIKHPEQAEAFLSVGESARDPDAAAPPLAAAGVLAKAIMNYDECVIKR